MMTRLFDDTPKASGLQCVTNRRDFDGETYEVKRDGVRMGRALTAIYRAMSDGCVWTIPALAKVAKCSEQGASARIRDLRKPRFGGHEVQRERIDGGLFGYRLKSICHRCKRDMRSVSGGIGNVTHDGTPWCGCVERDALRAGGSV